MGEAIGIDLGTTNSGAGYFEDGQVRIILTTQAEPLTPSVVSYIPRRDQMLTGRQAWRQVERFPDSTVFSIKRLMGRTFDDQDIDKVMRVQERFGYRIVEADDPQDRGLRVQLGPEKLSPVDISAMILAQVKEDASRRLGKPVTHAVVTVPAYFNERQRAATRLAAEKAGLIVKKIIDEPTAAAVAFGMDHAAERHRLLVYDLGGGTFDISLIQTTQHQFQVLGIEGDNWLGGDDFDLEIVQRMLDWIQDNEGLDLSQDKAFLAAAKKMAEQAKIALSGQDEAEIYDEIKTEAGTRVTVDMEITRTQFESWIRPYVDHSMDLVRKLLTSQDLTPDDITAVLMVGGATNVPLVYKTVGRTFKDRMRRDVDPMQCVALGAGILAARLKTIECPQCGYENPQGASECERCRSSLEHTTATGDIALSEVTPHSLGIEVVRGRTPGMFSPIIKKGTLYPVSISAEGMYYTTSDRRLRLPVYEGEHELTARNELQAIVEFDLPQSVPPKTGVAVTFGLDRDRVLTVSVRVQGYPDLTFEEIVKRDRARPTREPSQAAAQPEEHWQRELQNVIVVANNFIDQYHSYLPTGVQKKLTSDVERGRQALREGSEVEGKRIAEAIFRTILGSGAATQLFLVERIIDDVGAADAQLLTEAVQELHVAHKGGDAEREEQLTAALEVKVGSFFEQKGRQKEYDRRATDLDFEGLLLEELLGGR